jgi:hypothetical protein
MMAISRVFFLGSAFSLGRTRIAFQSLAGCQRALKTSHRWALENQPL